jgi:hypothetical protein
MAGKGGKRVTSFKPTWNLGATDLIRLPKVLIADSLARARARDEGRDPDKEAMLAYLNRFIEKKRHNWGKNSMQKGKEFSMTSRSWDYFKEFKQAIEQEEL